MYWVTKDDPVEVGFVVNSLLNKRGKYLFRKTHENLSLLFVSMTFFQMYLLNRFITYNS